MKKYIFITGGVYSGLGKGIAAASIGFLLKSRGYKVTIQKFDPYLNVDAGTLNPKEHGEVFVTADGGESDLDLGHYERFINEKLTRNSCITSGRVYLDVIEKERKGDKKYLGKTIQIVPHITDHIKEKIRVVGEEQNADIVITEIGGTVGDIEGLPFLEAIRQFQYDMRKENVIFIHLTAIPQIDTSGELKTKPTQHSVKEMLRIGIQPDILICRTPISLDENNKKKIAAFCNVSADCVFEGLTVSNIYEIPLRYYELEMDTVILEKLNLPKKKTYLKEWVKIIDEMSKANKPVVKIAVVGKYMELKDAYLSVFEALKHAGVHNGVELETICIDSEELEVNGVGSDELAHKLLSNMHGILVPGGFGSRGIEGKIVAAKFAREHDIPYFGICLGMQIATIEFARNVCGLDATSEEFANGKEHVIHLMKDQVDVTHKGGTMRLGDYNCVLNKDSHSYKAYNKDKVVERHRHRYEFNNDYRNLFIEKGMVIAGVNPENDLVEIIELKDKLWFVGAQFHPEFSSRLIAPQALFKDFIRHSKIYKDGKK